MYLSLFNTIFLIYSPRNTIDTLFADQVQSRKQILRSLPQVANDLRKFESILQRETSQLSQHTQRLRAVLPRRELPGFWRGALSAAVLAVLLWVSERGERPRGRGRAFEGNHPNSHRLTFAMVCTSISGEDS